MPTRNINDLAEITTAADDDLIIVHDVSDGSEGTEKKIQKGNLTSGGVSDHGGLSGLGDDDHTQYTIISSGAGAPSSTPTRVGALYVDTSANAAYVATGTSSSADWVNTSAGGGSGNFVVSVSDEITYLAAGAARVTFPWPYSGVEVSEVFALVNEAPTGSALVIDVNDDGTSILGGTISISAGATTGNVTGLSVTPALKSVMTVDIDSVGSTTAGKGLKLLFILA